MMENDCQNESEAIQKKLYFLTKNLTDMHSNLRSYEIQSRISLENLTMIANILIEDPNIFEIIKGLIDCQNATEKNLQEYRNNHISLYQREIENYTRTLDESELAHTVALAKLQHEKKMREIDKDIVLQLDEAVKEQQQTLYTLKIPGFFVTTERILIETQMHLFNFLKELLKVKDALDNCR